MCSEKRTGTDRHGWGEGASMEEDPEGGTEKGSISFSSYVFTGENTSSTRVRGGKGSRWVAFACEKPNSRAREGACPGRKKKKTSWATVRHVGRVRCCRGKKITVSYEGKERGKHIQSRKGHLESTYHDYKSHKYPISKQRISRKGVLLSQGGGSKPLTDEKGEL